MSVLLETSKGDLVIDLFLDEAPQACENFLKLCKIKYYNNCLFHSLQQNHTIECGDPSFGNKSSNVYNDVAIPSSIYGIVSGGVR